MCNLNCSSAASGKPKKWKDIHCPVFDRIFLVAPVHLGTFDRQTTIIRTKLANLAISISIVSRRFKVLLYCSIPIHLNDFHITKAFFNLHPLTHATQLSSRLRTHAEKRLETNIAHLEGDKCRCIVQDSVYIQCAYRLEMFGDWSDQLMPWMFPSVSTDFTCYSWGYLRVRAIEFNLSLIFYRSVS